ncbi:hypothetical protein Gotri_007654 [Gossypium trilobum]|uniref:Uncharacterized protein n=1 Tax=Gossypium trilobum TaxID=34281 RepID=A0A7J9EHA4_9ROSI|nr:hypothetical protein [Gossypium trilobum]
MVIGKRSLQVLSLEKCFSVAYFCNNCLLLGITLNLSHMWCVCHPLSCVYLLHHLSSFLLISVFSYFQLRMNGIPKLLAEYKKILPEQNASGPRAGFEEQVL